MPRRIQHAYMTAIDFSISFSKIYCTELIQYWLFIGKIGHNGISLSIQTYIVSVFVLFITILHCKLAAPTLKTSIQKPIMQGLRKIKGGYWCFGLAI